MNIGAHLIVSSSGSVRVTKNKPALDANEIAIKLTIAIPDAYFERPYPAVKIEFDQRIADMLATKEHADVAINLTASYVADALKIDAADVRDGLTELVNEKKEEDRLRIDRLGE